MSTAAPDLAPLFRSPQQMWLLAEVFHGEPAAGAELARRLGIAQSTVARELGRLEDAGLIELRSVGTAKVAVPSDAPPFAPARGAIVPTARTGRGRVRPLRPSSTTRWQSDSSTGESTVGSTCSVGSVTR